MQDASRAAPITPAAGPDSTIAAGRRAPAASDITLPFDCMRKHRRVDAGVA